MLLISMFFKWVKGFKSSLTITQISRHSIVFTRAGQNKLKLDFNIVRSDVTDCLFSGKKFEIVRRNEKAIVAFAYRKQKVSVMQC